jgi:histidinol-phosphatase (PHP family)
MILSNYHTHTEYCDGLSTIQESIEEALTLGFRSLGFSSHGYVPFDGLYSGMPIEDIQSYLETIGEMKRRYSGQIEIYAGLENDSASMIPAEIFDYTIGSVHCIKSSDKYYSVDSRDTKVAAAIKESFNGDGLEYALAYYKALIEFASKRHADILGHLDVVRRFNTMAAGREDAGGYRFFDEESREYRNAALQALETAVRSDYFIEVSTGPLSKGFSREPYPAVFILERAKELDARIVVGSDAHSARHLNHGFDKMESLLRKIGFTHRWELTPEGFAAGGLCQ